PDLVDQRQLGGPEAQAVAVPLHPEVDVGRLLARVLDEAQWKLPELRQHVLGVRRRRTRRRRCDQRRRRYGQSKRQCESQPQGKAKRQTPVPTSDRNHGYAPSIPRLSPSQVTLELLVAGA